MERASMNDPAALSSSDTPSPAPPPETAGAPVAPPTPAGGRPPWRRWLLYGRRRPATAAAVALVARATGLWPTDLADDADPFALPPVSSSPFLNTRADARYIGTKACRACHEGAHVSFRGTGMGR